jgi:hypothetical protein
MPTTAELKSTLRALADWHAAKADLGGPDVPMHSQAVLALHIAACALPAPCVHPRPADSADVATAMIAAAEARRAERLQRAREATADHGARLLGATLTALQRRTP